MVGGERTTFARLARPLQTYAVTLLTREHKPTHGLGIVDYVG
jgi:hypothetical protein